MPKRSASDALAAVVPAPKQVDSGIRSRSGRTVKPRVWDDGTLAAPLAVLKHEAGERSPGGEERQSVDRADAADPDFTPQEGDDGDEGRGHGGHAHGQAHGQVHKQHQGSGGSEEDEAAASDSESPRVSLDGSQGGASTGRARSGSVGRDEHGKFTTGLRPRGARGRGRGEGGGGIFKQAAVEVLRLEKRLMSTGEIARMALKRGLIKCTGKTPEATMASALYTDIKRKEGQSVFIRPHEGLFGLREWIEQGVAFQDEFAEEMAKRAAAAYGAYVGMQGMPMMAPMMDADGMPIATPFPVMPFPGMAMLPPMLPGVAHPLAMAPPAALAGAAAKGGGADGGDGLMELLEAAEELHKSAEKGGAQAAGEAYSPTGEAAAMPAATSAEAQQAQQVDAEGPAPFDAEHQPASTPPGGATGAAARQPDAVAEQQPGRSDAAAAAAAADEEGDAVAALAAVAVGAAAAGAKLSPPSAGQAGSAGRQRGGYPEGAMAYPMQYGYPPYFYPYPAFMLPPHTTGLPPLPKTAAAVPRGGAQDAVHAAHAVPELLPAGSTAGLDLTVHGTNRPFVAARGGSLAAAVEAAGQEQVNILNLPLPDRADVAQAPAGGRGGIAPPPTRGRPEPEQLKEAEASVMLLEKELGTSHPEVGKAYLSLSRLYLAGCEDGTAKQLATAALSRSWEILNVCQLALKKQPSCTSSFSYLMDKIRTAEGAPVTAVLAPALPPVGAAPPASAGVPPAALPAAAAALSLASPPPAAAGQRQPGSGGGAFKHSHIEQAVHRF